MGFDRLRVTARHVSGARPGKEIDVTIDLLKDLYVLCATQIRLLIDIENRFDEGNSIADVLRSLRSNGFSVLDAIKVMMRLTGVSLAEAKQVVHTSEVWSDRRAMHDAFHHGLIGGQNPFARMKHDAAEWLPNGEAARCKQR